MRALDRKLWRDLWHMKGQAVAIGLVILCGVATYIMFIAILDSLRATRADYYAQNRFADVFASLKRAPEGLRRRIEAIPGVARVETRVVAGVNLDIAEFPEPVTGLVVSVPDDGYQPLNALYLRSGRYVEPNRADEVVISEAFAEAHGLVPGDRLAAVINGRRQALTIVGTALSPEYIHQLRPGGVFPDYKRYGVMWMGREALGNALDMDGAFNDAVLDLAAGASERDVIDRLDRLLDRYGGLGAYGREDQRSHRFLDEEFNQLAMMSRIFPVIFLGVAAFLLNVVITRLIGLQREQIATLKAFGYGNAAVTWHYLKLVLLVVLFGVAGGIAVGTWLAHLMGEIYMEFFRFPYLAFALEPHVVIEATAASVGAGVLGTVLAVRRAAALKPAEAMQPEPPARYRESWPERLGLRGWLSPSNRMILRHIGRRPFKSAVTVCGIAVACGITMTGHFQKDTVGYMIEVQYGMSQREDISLVFTEPTSYRARYELAALPGVRRVEVQRSVPVELRHGYRSYRTAIKGMQSGGDLQRLLDADLRPIALPPSGVILTDYLAELLGVAPGESLTVEVLEGGRPVREVRVAGVVKEYLGVSAYMELAALNRFMREGPAISGAWLAVGDGDELTRLYRELKDMPRVAGVALRKQEIRNFNKTMNESLLFYTFVALIFSVIIAFGVVYNSARIALAERSRELASLRVLGFTRGEISYILLGELGLLTLVALPLGLLAGRGLCWFIAHNLQNDLYRLPLMLQPSTYAFAVTVVIAAAAVSGLAVRGRLDRLDLIGVLKTKE
ncbi:MAG: ABC transporter permease [Gammaproteobacteria bacterium]|nr:ABC transporter permease [Gammaproteobacteria bacterium]